MTAQTASLKKMYALATSGLWKISWIWQSVRLKLICLMISSTCRSPLFLAAIIYLWNSKVKRFVYD